MRSYFEQPSPPSQDKRWKIVEATMRRHGYSPNSLIESLHTVQEFFGFLDDDALGFVAGSLRLPLSKVYGVATFYHFFTLKPKGEHACVVCMGTACYIKGAPQILAGLEKNLAVKPGETTADGKVSVLTARCVGTCGIAPAVVLDSEVVGKQTAASVLSRIERWR